MKSVLYIGGFELPDKNAAAQRVLPIAKALRECGFETRFYGTSLSNDYKGSVDGFDYEACPYPRRTADWVEYALGDGILAYIKHHSPDFVFLYNYPAIAQERIISFCKRNDIKTVGDITEWYRATTLPKRFDTFFRMHYSNFHLDGIIAISKYLADYYKEKKLIQLPPLVDKQEKKWQTVPEFQMNDRIRLVYIGTGSIKDRLDMIIKGIKLANSDRFHFDVIGISKEHFHEIYKEDPSTLDIVFHGRLPHRDALKYLMSADFQIFFRDFIQVNNAGFPTKFVESMSAGVPVITNRISNICDYVINGKNSFMIERPDDREICDVLKLVSSLSRDEINTIKSNCLRETFDYRNYTHIIEDFMNRL